MGPYIHVLGTAMGPYRSRNCNGSIYSCSRNCFLRALQATMWPAVSKLQSMLVVAPPSTRSPVSSWAEGKTLGWLLPVLAILAEPPATPRSGPQPRLVVICPGLELVSFIADLINQVAVGIQIPLKLVEDSAGLREVEASVFINGIDVLVTTPARLLDRMEEKQDEKFVSPGIKLKQRQVQKKEKQQENIVYPC